LAQYQDQNTHINKNAIEREPSMKCLGFDIGYLDLFIALKTNEVKKITKNIFGENALSFKFN
jgi:hypothetical protein